MAIISKRRKADGTFERKVYFWSEAEGRVDAGIHVRLVHPAEGKKKEPVGEFLTNRIDGLLGIKTGKGCDCRDLAAKMNAWGISGCELPKNRKEIIETLLKNREILKVSLAKSAFAFVRQEGVVESMKMVKKLAGDWWHQKDVEEEAFQDGANWLLDRALEDTRRHVVENQNLVDEAIVPAQSVSSANRSFSAARSSEKTGATCFCE